MHEWRSLKLCRDTRELTFSLGVCHHLIITPCLCHLAVTLGGYHCATKNQFSGFCPCHLCNKGQRPLCHITSMCARKIFFFLLLKKPTHGTSCQILVWTSSGAWTLAPELFCSHFKSDKGTLCHCRVLAVTLRRF